MRPTPQQKQWLQEYLRAVLTYRETYEEVYDHVISAVGDATAGKFFEGTILAIIENDFGGSNGLKLLDENYKNSFTSEAAAKYGLYFSKKRLAYVFGVAAAIYYLAIAIYKTYNVHILSVRYEPIVAIACWLVPLILLAAGGIKVGYQLKNSRSSARVEVFRRIALRPFKYLFYWVGFDIVLFSVLDKIFKKQNYIIIETVKLFSIVSLILGLAVVILSIIHLVAFYKIYKGDFKQTFAEK